MAILKGRPFAVYHGDNLKVMQSLPTGCVDVAVTSPPYESQRTYGIGFKLVGQKWVDWMIPRVVEACRVTAGLVFVNMAGKVKDFSYGPVVEWLVADLTREHGLVCGPAPYVFRRVGIPGSGSKHYHRRDWEPVYGFALPGNLPPRWSDNLAFGHPPKWAPGGEMSNRQTDGARVNAHGLTGEVTTHGRHKATKDRDSYGFTPHDGEPIPTARANGESRRYSRGKGRNANGRNTRPSPYAEPVLANPGNVIQEKYTAEQVAAILSGEPADVIECIVGGGVMGSKLAHLNEAPFPLSLASWFVKSFCPPGGIALDFNAGSGTVLQAALENGRRGMAIEIRDEMVELCYARAQEALEKQNGKS